jgi:type IV secretion system protein VirB2
MTAKTARSPIRITRILAPAIVAVLSCAATRAFAAGAGMPWEGPLMQLVSSLTGPVAKAIGIFAIAACGVGLAMSEGGHGARKIIGVLLGVCILFTAGTFGVSFLGFSGGLAP